MQKEPKRYLFYIFSLYICAYLTYFPTWTLMNQFINLILFLPSIVCLIWAFIYFFRKKNLTQKLLFALIVFQFLYFTCFAVFLTPFTSYRTLSVLNLLCHIIVHPALATYIIYIHAHRANRLMSLSKAYLLYVPALIHGSVMTLLYVLIGFDGYGRFVKVYRELLALHPGKQVMSLMPEEFQGKLYEILILFDMRIVNYFCFLLASIILYQCYLLSRSEGYKFGNVFGFFFLGKKSTSNRVISFLTFVLLGTYSLILGTDYAELSHYTWVGMVLSVFVSIVLFCLFYCENYIDTKEITLYSLANATVTLEYVVDRKDEKIVEEKSDERQQEEEAAASEEVIAEAKVEPIVEVKAETVAEEMKSSAVEAESLPEENESIAIEEREPVSIIDEQSTSISEIEPLPLETTENRQPQEQNEVFNPKRTALVYKLQEFINDKSVYTDNELNIDVLAIRLGTNRSTLSSLINQTYGMNFKTLIATLRIEEAKRILKTNPTMPIEVIATSCGYKDKVNFFRRFKELTGDTPRVWLMKEKGN